MFSIDGISFTAPGKSPSWRWCPAERSPWTSCRRWRHFPLSIRTSSPPPCCPWGCPSRRQAWQAVPPQLPTGPNPGNTTLFRSYLLCSNGLLYCWQFEDWCSTDDNWVRYTLFIQRFVWLIQKGGSCSKLVWFYSWWYLLLLVILPKESDNRHLQAAN